MTTNETAFTNAQKQLKKSFDLLNWYSKNYLEYVLNPKKIIEVNIPVMMDDWTLRNFVWYRSQHSNARWPFKWWIRFHPDVNIDEVKALSIWMSIKTWVVDIPLWGWKGWIIVNPHDLSQAELERLSRWYVREIYKNIWPNTDIPAPDVNTNWQIMAWMVDEYMKLTWTNDLWTFTWKPLAIWWSLWRDKATAQWWLFVLEKYLNLANIKLSWKKIIIQWLWNAWLTMLKLLKEKWVIIVWVADSKTWIYNENWLNLDEIIRLKSERLPLETYPNATKLSPKEILTQKTDILIPAALENQITLENVENIKANIILELANWPITANADEILFNKNIVVIPDILANAWWVMVSYFEQVQNNQNYYWDLKEVDEKLFSKITKATNDVYEISNIHKVSLRDWAYMISLKRIFDALKYRWEIK